MNAPAPSLLILSFSPLASDPRVRRQITLFADRYHVTTVGFGPGPDPRVEHVQLPEGTRAWPSSKQHLLSGRYRGAYWHMSAVAAAHDLLADRIGRFDMVLANDVNSLPLALWLRPRLGVHADLHEFSPREKEHDLKWRLFVAPFMRWICRTCLPEVSSVTTVSPGLADAYAHDFGVEVAVVTNASRYEDRPVRPTRQPLRLLHTGVARRNRHLESMIEGMRELDRDLELDLMLMPSEPGYIEELAERAADLPTVRFRAPVPFDQLVGTVAEYDVSLPNKLFEAVQGRVAVIVGPSPDMADLVREHGIGLVLPGADAASLHAAFETLEVEQVDAWKLATDRAARELSAEQQQRGWEEALASIAREV
jgi:glycosyltransferase involved in cell wall biosynthesis